MTKIAVIGGGIAGCTTSLELAKYGYEIILFEHKEDILQGTSARTPGRMGLGYHYFHSDTAKRYMKQTIEFMKIYDDCFLGADDAPHLRDGRYFITKDSLLDYQELMANYDDVSFAYESFCKENSENKIFDTFHLHRTLHRREFQDDVNMERVAFAIQTKERLLDWNKFSLRLKDEISKFPNIHIKVGSGIRDISMTEMGNFILDNHEVDYVVNCTWQNIESVNKKLGIGSAHFKKDNPNHAITSRLKLLVEVGLPDNLKDKHSMFFCVGPHAMFSNLGDGIGRITYAPVTNFGSTTESEMPDHFKRWLNVGLDKEETRMYGQAIINGVADYIPAMKDAKLSRVIAGIVKNIGSVEITDKDSPFHKRDYSGVEEQQIGWIDNAAMKLFYCLGNAKEVKDIIDKQEKAKKTIEDIIDFDQINDPSILGKFFTSYLRRYSKSDDLESDKTKSDLKKQKDLKGLVVKEVVNVGRGNSGRQMV